MATYSSTSSSQNVSDFKLLSTEGSTHSREISTNMTERIVNFTTSFLTTETTLTQNSSAFTNSYNTNELVSTHNYTTIDSTHAVTSFVDFNVSSASMPFSLCNSYVNNTILKTDYSYLLPSFVYVCILLVFGFFGNALVIYVYYFKWPKSTSRVFILALAGCDIINCSTSMPHELVLLINFDTFDFPVICKVSRFITGMMNNTTTFLLVVIAIDRFKRICKPHAKHISPCLGKKLVLAATIFGICTNWPMLFLYGSMTLPGGGTTCLIENKMLKTKFPMVFILFLLLGHFVTDCILVVLYALVGRAIFKRRHFLKTSSTKMVKPEVSQSSYTVDELDSQESDSQETRPRFASFVFWNRVSEEFRNRSNTTPESRLKNKRNNHLPKKKSMTLLRRALSRIASDPSNQGNQIRVGKTTLMLFLVTIVFIVSFIPHTAMVILRYANPPFVLCLSHRGKVFYQLTLRTYLLNSVLNPFVYCFVSNQFRSKSTSALRQLFCCSKTNPGNSRSVTGGHSHN